MEALEIVKELGCHIKAAELKRKGYLKAKIRTPVWKVLIRIINGRITQRNREAPNRSAKP